MPVCISDHILTFDKLTSVFFLCLDRENGVFGLTSRSKPRAFFTSTSREDSPFRSFEGHKYCALASATNDSLVEIVGWNVGLVGV